LYWLRSLHHDPEDKRLGSEIYAAFTNVIILKDQMHVTDPEWIDLLRHARRGKCSERHLHLLRSRRHQPMTPRHGVHTEWNAAAAKLHSSSTKHQLFTSPAKDMVKKRPLTVAEHRGIALKPAQSGKSKMEPGRLPTAVDVAIRMHVMVTTNIDIDRDVANGACSKVVG
ncbi:hypothetical protein BS47DRAFT_1306508, partial [Hydnum rufescens UP504]